MNEFIYRKTLTIFLIFFFLIYFSFFYTTIFNK